jgi:hypothetical protein
MEVPAASEGRERVVPAERAELADQAAASVAEAQVGEQARPGGPVAMRWGPRQLKRESEDSAAALAPAFPFQRSLLLW